MLGYHLQLAWRSLGHRFAYTALIAISIGVGVGSTTSMLALVRAMTADPAPAVSGDLYYLQIDAAPPDFAETNALDTSTFVTWTDASNLLHAKPTPLAAMMAGVFVHARSSPEAPAHEVGGRMASQGFFRVFGAPFRSGRGWTGAEAARRSRVVVLNSGMARRVFGAATAIGHDIFLDDSRFTVVGVLDDWNPRPLFYESNGRSAWGRKDDFFIPMETARDLGMQPGGGMICWAEGKLDGDACGWLQFWLRIPPNELPGFEAFLRSYADEEASKGRSIRVVGTGLLDLPARMQAMNVLPPAVRMEKAVSFAFLAICILNCSGLLLAKFHAKSREISLRRALGASRSQVFAQLASEGAIIGLCGSVVGWLAACGWISLLRARPVPYAQLAGLDLRTLLLLAALSMGSCLLAAAVPAWRACGIDPAARLKDA